VNLLHLFFGFDGRISRSWFWIGLLVLAVAEVAAMFALGVPFLPKQMNPLPVRMRDAGIQLVSLYPTAAIMVKRLHDRDYPGMHAAWFIGLVLVILITYLAGYTGDPNYPSWLDFVLGFVTIVVGLAFLIDLGFRRGTVGENRFGPDPLDGKPAG
jgi:uncharacterized membrane protein YhaH (DUF805 family)